VGGTAGLGLVGARRLWGAAAGDKPPAGEGKPARPNIVYILADDMGYGDVGCYNAQAKIPTPNIDRLAKEGMHFTDAHSGSAVCSPTRYGILTGRYAWRGKLKRGVLGPYDPPLIEEARLTVPGLLKRHGYRTACVGKWHLGWDWPKEGGQVIFGRPIANGPTTRGFDTYFGTDVPNYPPYCFLDNDRTVGQPTARKEMQDLNGRPGPMLPGWRFDAILPKLAEKAVEFIAQRAADKQPFFLYFPLTSPHEPIAPSERFRGRSGISPLGDFMVETDWAAGEVLAALDHGGLAGGTLVIFTTDNGHAPYTGLAELQKAGHEPSAPWRGYKADIWEGGHRVPHIVRWPGVTPAGATCDQTICHTHLMATCAEILGSKLPEDAGEDSFSILPLLQGQKPAQPTQEAVVHHSAAGVFAIRRGPWKYIEPMAPASAPARAAKGGKYAKAGKPVKIAGVAAAQLYNLQADPGEKQNVLDSHPEVARELADLLGRYKAAGRSR